VTASITPAEPEEVPAPAAALLPTALAAAAAAAATAAASGATAFTVCGCALPPPGNAVPDLGVFGALLACRSASCKAAANGTGTAAEPAAALESAADVVAAALELAAPAEAEDPQGPEADIAV
jgi:hypothetical protein